MQIKNILIVSSEFPPLPGGIGNHAYNLAKNLNGVGHKIKVIVDQRSMDLSNDLIFDESLPFKVTRIKITRLRFLMYFTRLIKVFQNIKKYDIIMASGKFSLWSVAFGSLFYRKKNIAIVHGTEVNFKSKFLRFTIDQSLKKFSKIVAVSNYTRSLINHINVPTIVIPNGIDESNFNISTIRDIEIKGSPSLITVGRISDRKGQLRVLEFIGHLKSKYPDIHYHCVGLIPSGLDYRSKISDLELNNQVTFHGVIDNLKLKELLKASDIFVMLSKEDDKGDVEGFGIAILEANAMATPAIGSKDCGIEDAIKQGDSGYLVNPNNIDEFSEAIQQILNEKERLSVKALDWSRKHFWSKIIEKYRHVL